MSDAKSKKSITSHATSAAGIFEAGQSTNTPLTPNSNAVASASGDSNDDTTVAFQYNNITTYWSPTVSSATTDVSLGANRGNGVVTFVKGLTVSYLAQAAGMYTVVVSGTIVDSGSEYTLTGRSLGSFPQKGPK
ncbi:MAG: hypothetical protein JO040_06220 [Gemmatimonadetes bacterium]|nr:hypothetical protein [Gemmatimonadota bacterium]